MKRFILLSCLAMALSSLYSQCFYENPIMCSGRAIGKIDRLGDYYIDTGLIIDGCYENNSVILYNKFEKFGVADLNGHVIIDFLYDSIKHFSNGGWQIYKEDSWRIIKANGEMLAQDAYLFMRKESCGWFAVKLAEGQWNFINKKGEYINQTLYVDVYDFHEGLASVKNNMGYWGVIDTTGKTVFDFIFSQPVRFSESMAFLNTYMDCANEGYTEDFYNRNKKAIKKYYAVDYWGYFINLKGKKQAKLGIYELARPFSDGLAFVVSEGQEKQGYIDHTGNMVIDLTDLGYTSSAQGTIYPCGDFHHGVAPFKKNNKWGYIDNTGKEIFEARFDDMVQFTNNICIVAENDRSQILINNKGMVLSDYWFNRPLPEGLISMHKYYSAEAEGKDRYGSGYNIYGFMTHDSTIVIEPQYYFTEEFHQGLAQVVKDTTWTGDYQKSAYINAKGEIICDWFDEVTYFNGNYFWANKQNSYAMFDQSGEMLTPWYDSIGLGPVENDDCGYGFYWFLNYFSDSMMAFQREDTWGFLDLSGKEVIDNRYYEVKNFHRGAAFVRAHDSWYLIDREGKKISEKFDNIYESEELIVRVMRDSLWGYYYRTEKQIPLLSYDYVSVFENNPFAFVIKDKKMKLIDRQGNPYDRSVQDCFDFKDGLAKIYGGKKPKWDGSSDNEYDTFGFIDTLGNVIARFIYQAANDFYEDLAAVKTNDKWGYINRTGKLVIPAIYTQAGNFKNGLANVTKDNYDYYHPSMNWFNIDAKGKFVKNAK